MNSNRIVYYDGLRTIFCFIVIFSHISLAFYPNHKTIILNDGNLAVMYFLVLSGGVTTLSASRISDNITIKELIVFIKKRYLRLLPIIVLSIMISFVIQCVGGILIRKLPVY